MSLSGEIEIVYNQVNEIMRQKEEARNNDNWLWYWIIKTYHYPGLYFPFEILNNMPTFETCRRIRQKIQNEEKRYMPTNPEIFQKRRLRQDEMRHLMVRTT